MSTTLQPLAGRQFARIRSIAVVLAMGLLLVLALVPQAARADTRHVIDESGVLSDSEEQQLEDQILATSSKYDQDIVILIADLNGMTPMARADDYFDYNDYGIGPNRSGVLLLISPESRDWWISTRGASITTFTDQGIEALGARLKPSLSDNEWYKASTLFVDECDRYMQAASKGKPITRAPLHPATWLINSTLATFGVFFGGLCTVAMVHGFFVSKMKNEGLEPTAKNYVVPNSLAITTSRDTFISRNVDRTRKESKSSSSGSSTHTSSSGSSHGGGGGKF